MVKRYFGFIATAAQLREDQIGNLRSALFPRRPITKFGLYLYFSFCRNDADVALILEFHEYPSIMNYVQNHENDICH